MFATFEALHAAIADAVRRQLETTTAGRALATAHPELLAQLERNIVGNVTMAAADVCGIE